MMYQSLSDEANEERILNLFKTLSYGQDGEMLHLGKRAVADGILWHDGRWQYLIEVKCRKIYRAEHPDIVIDRAKVEAIIDLSCKLNNARPIFIAGWNDATGFINLLETQPTRTEMFERRLPRIGRAADPHGDRDLCNFYDVNSFTCIERR